MPPNNAPQPTLPRPTPQPTAPPPQAPPTPPPHPPTHPPPNTPKPPHPQQPPHKNHQHQPPTHPPPHPQKQPPTPNNPTPHPPPAPKPHHQHHTQPNNHSSQAPRHSPALVSQAHDAAAPAPTPASNRPPRQTSAPLCPDPPIPQSGESGEIRSLGTGRTPPIPASTPTDQGIPHPHQPPHPTTPHQTNTRRKATRQNAHPTRRFWFPVRSTFAEHPPPGETGATVSVARQPAGQNRPPRRVAPPRSGARVSGCLWPPGQTDPLPTSLSRRPRSSALCRSISHADRPLIFVTRPPWCPQKPERSRGDLRYFHGFPSASSLHHDSRCRCRGRRMKWKVALVAASGLGLALGSRRSQIGRRADVRLPDRPRVRARGADSVAGEPEQRLLGAASLALRDGRCGRLGSVARMEPVGRANRCRRTGGPGRRVRDSTGYRSAAAAAAGVGHVPERFGAAGAREGVVRADGTRPSWRSISGWA